MGCGHSKINIYPKKYKTRNSPKKSVTPEKEPEVAEVVENNCEVDEKFEDCDQRKAVKVKPFGGPLLAHVEVSSSQQNFFQMLDEKIDNGPDYDSASETEKAAEAARLRALLKDWETASACSRSLPSTPIRRAKAGEHNVRGNDGIRIYGMESVRYVEKNIPPSAYNYRAASYNPIYQQQHNAVLFSSAMQYQALSPMYVNQTPYPKYYPSYNQHGSPIKMTAQHQPNSVKHIPYEQPQVTYSPSHKIYGNVPKSSAGFTNGDLIVQQQMYNQQIQYQQSREYQQYRQSKEQLLLQQQQTYQSSRSYQSSVHIPIVMHTPQTDASPLHRKQYEMT